MFSRSFTRTFTRQCSRFSTDSNNSNWSSAWSPTPKDNQTNNLNSSNNNNKVDNWKKNNVDFASFPLSVNRNLIVRTWNDMVLVDLRSLVYLSSLSLSLIFCIASLPICVCFVCVHQRII